jgi:hypothetical protein
MSSITYFLCMSLCFAGTATVQTRGPAGLVLAQGESGGAGESAGATSGAAMAPPLPSSSAVECDSKLNQVRMALEAVADPSVKGKMTAELRAGERARSDGDEKGCLSHAENALHQVN